MQQTQKLKLIYNEFKYILNLYVERCVVDKKIKKHQKIFNKLFAILIKNQYIKNFIGVIFVSSALFLMDKLSSRNYCIKL